MKHLIILMILFTSCSVSREITVNETCNGQPVVLEHWEKTQPFGKWRSLGYTRIILVDSVSGYEYYYEEN